MDTTNSSQELQTEMELFAEWCKQNCLDLNPSKTKELVIDFHKDVSIIPTLLVNNQPIERVELYKYLGTILDHKLNFQLNSENIFF